MTSYTASSELGPGSAFSTDALTLSSDSGPNLPTPLTGWDELPPPLTSSVAWWGRGRKPGAERDGELPLPSPSPSRFFSPPFRIG